MVMELLRRVVASSYVQREKQNKTTGYCIHVLVSWLNRHKVEGRLSQWENKEKENRVEMVVFLSSPVEHSVVNEKHNPSYQFDDFVGEEFSAFFLWSG